MSKFGACVDTTLTWIGNNKLVTLLGIVAFSLMVSTWTLAAINSNLNEEIDEMKRGMTTTPPPKDTTDTATPATEVTTEAATLTTTEATTIPTNTTEPGQNLRLSEFVIPTMYELLIHPDLTPGGEGRFTGSEKIFLDISEPTDIIVLHSHELNISKVEFTALNSNVQVSNYQLDIELEQLRIELNKTIDFGENYELVIEFNGSMRDKIVGLYSSTYKDENGNDSSLKQLYGQQKTAKMENTSKSSQQGVWKNRSRSVQNC